MRSDVQSSVIELLNIMRTLEAAEVSRFWLVGAFRVTLDVPIEPKQD